MLAYPCYTWVINGIQTGYFGFDVFNSLHEVTWSTIITITVVASTARCAFLYHAVYNASYEHQQAHCNQWGQCIHQESAGMDIWKNINVGKLTPLGAWTMSSLLNNTLYPLSLAILRITWSIGLPASQLFSSPANYCNTTQSFGGSKFVLVKKVLVKISWWK